MLEAGPPLAQLLSACPRLKVVVTNRVVLRLQGAHNYEVPTLTLPPAGYRPSHEVDRYEGIHMFADRARAASLCRESLILSSKLDNKSHVAFCLTVLAGVIQATGDAARAARLFGAAEMLLQSLDAVLDPSGTLEYDSNLAGTRARLGVEAFAKAWQEGRTMTLEQAVKEAMNKRR